MRTPSAAATVSVVSWAVLYVSFCATGGSFTAVTVRANVVLAVPPSASLTVTVMLAVPF